MGFAAALSGKSNEYVAAISPLIWGGAAPLSEWPKMVPKAFERADPEICRKKQDYPGLGLPRFNRRPLL